MLPDGYKKTSFLKFDFRINTKKLEKEFQSIPSDSWESSYWGNVHCSVGMLLLRGGQDGTENDFYSDQVYDQSILHQLPYIEQLISEEGPFGKAIYAFIFRLKPNGVTLLHQDLIKKWEDMYRIHIPIITNDGAFLIAGGKSQHFEVGSAWTFDNQSDHGVVNGNHERIHLIFDVPFSNKMSLIIDNAEYLSGKTIQKNIDEIEETSKVILSYPGDQVMQSAIKKLRANGANDSQIATFFNMKLIPSKSYPVKLWNSKMVIALSKINH